jgi:hypothetical protein
MTYDYLVIFYDYYYDEVLICDWLHQYHPTGCVSSFLTSLRVELKLLCNVKLVECRIIGLQINVRFLGYHHS